MQNNFCADSYFLFIKPIFLLLLVSSLLGGCSSQKPIEVEPIKTVKAQPKPTYHSYYGKKAYNRPYRVRGKTYYPMRSASGYRERGTASWYGSESGNRTAMGSRFRPNGLTAAHKTLPLPSRVKVTNLRNRRSVVVLVNDRGPFARNRLIDLSRGAAKAIGMNGVAEVEVEYLEESSQNEYE